jgi:NNP family nitrate/nitrite transporter-like MFS transporter
MWLQRPPTRMYWRRGWQAFFSRRALAGNTVSLGRRALLEFAANAYIFRRGRLRGLAHWLIMWGCLLAAAITFPLVFGWIHFGSLGQDPRTYVTYVFGFPTFSFRVRTAVAWLLFHGLDVAAVLVLTGIALSLWRRMRDEGALAVQSFAMDFFPLILLFAISTTGLALTASGLWLRGQYYGFLSILHAITVIAALLYLPFGKFFHIFQRPAQLGVKLYQDAGAAGEGAFCARCGERFASLMHVEDLALVLPQLGFDYRMPGPAGHWQQVCPACKRKSIALAQIRMKEAAGG